MTPDSHTLQGDRDAYRRWAGRWVARVEAATHHGSWRGTAFIVPTSPRTTEPWRLDQDFINRAIRDLQHDITAKNRVPYRG